MESAGPFARYCGTMSSGGSRKEIVQNLSRLMTAEDPVARMNDPSLLEEAVEALRQVVSSDFVFALFTPPEVGGDSAEYVGVDGFVDGWHDWLNAFDSFRIELGEQTEAGDDFTAMARMTAVPKGTAATIEGTAKAVFTFDGERLQRLEFHLEQGTTSRAAGLSE
jgi:SnoaL-like protein